MLALMALFLLLGSASLSIGALLEGLLGDTRALRFTSDRLLAMAWAGLLSVAWSLLVVAGFTAVSAGAALIVLALCHAPLVVPRVRRRLLEPLTAVSSSRANVLAVVMVVGGVSAFCSQLVLWGDTGL